MLFKIFNLLTRKKSPVVFQDMLRVVPACRNFGWERGTPVDRYYIEKFFCENRQVMQGKLLEVGDASYSRKYAGANPGDYNVLQHEAQGDASSATIIGDLADRATLPENMFDCFICAQTLQYTFEISKAVEGAFHLLKPGGVMLATVPGISQISRIDAERYGEYWRFTTDSMARLFRPVFGDDCQIASHGNVLSATAFLQGVVLEDLPDPSLLDVNDAEYQLIITIVARKPDSCPR